jgi:hypothetical protein
MEEPTINRPTPMTPENRRMLQGKNYGLENFLYGDNWLGTALYYKTMYPGFTDDQCRAMEAFSNGVTPKQYRNLLKKEKRKQQACSGSRRNQSSSSAPQNSYATNPSINK